jgi:type IX secretion system PorP/SprF family membrane protein
MKKNYLLQLCCFVLLLCELSLLNAQSIPVGTLYRNNFNLINPAAADRLLLSQTGNHLSRQITANVRRQWLLTQTQGTPLTAFFQFEQAPNDDAEYGRWKNKLRWGAQFFYDETDIMHNLGIYGNYSYEFKLGDGSRKVRLGLSPGLIYRRYDINNIRTEYPIESDPILSTIADNPNRLLFDVGMGVFMHRSVGYDTRYWGLSIPNGSMWQFKPDRPGSANLPNRFSQAYFILGTYISKWSNSSTRRIDWEPTIFIRGVRKGRFQTTDNFNTPISVDATLRAYFNLRKDLSSNIRFPPSFWLGAGFGTNRTLSAECGFNLSSKVELNRNTQLCFAYNAPANRGIAALGHSFEVNFTYSWK